MWRNDIREEVPYLLSIMRYVMLAFMTYFLCGRLQEQLVPNRVLLFLLGTFPDYRGRLWSSRYGYGSEASSFHYSGIFIQPDLIWHGYLLSHGSMGAGDVKLSRDYGNISDGKRCYSGHVFYGCLIALRIFDSQLDKKKITRKDRLPFGPPFFIWAWLSDIFCKSVMGQVEEMAKEE